MAALTNIGKFAKQIVLCKNNYSKIIVRCVYQKDSLDYWKPGLPPKTEEERRKAAEKYGMHPDEYKPLPESYPFRSDYPDLPAIGDIVKDDHYPWDYPVMKRMVDEPIHREYQIMTYDKIDYGNHYLTPPFQATLRLFGIILGIVIIMYTTDTYSHAGKFSVKQYPGEGVVHYTFEPAK